MPTTILPQLEKFASDLTKSFKLSFDFNPEDQLKKPVAELFEQVGTVLNLQIRTVTEVQEGSIGRPDMGITVKKLLVGHVELKAPGKGANPDRFKGRDKEQWERFKDLPNLIYTDGNEWSLFRSGERVGRMVRFSGEVTSEGKNAIDATAANALLDILRDFMRWNPIVPSSPRALAKMLAPICRLLRNDVLDALKEPDSSINALVKDWRRFLFPDADDNAFADAYAQTITYTLLLARLTGDETISIPEAVQQIRANHAFLADVLKVMGDPDAQKGIEMPIQLLERLIDAVDSRALAQKGDPWLYFYEDFLAAYDPKLRSDRGVYYTPVEVVQTQVRLVAELLEKEFDAQYSFSDEKVITLDPAAGTGTYLLAALNHALNEVEEACGGGMRRAAATQAAKNMHGFEIMVGPYTVAHLRMTQALTTEGAALPEDGVHIYLTDTLESPDAPPLEVPMFYKGWVREHTRARKIKKDTPVLVCIGNPPYDRQQVDPNDTTTARKGGWVRFGEGRPLLNDFTEPLTQLDLGVHAKNLYNDYVYFWRWALWKVVEKGGQGIVSFITASSYLRGPGFAGMREFMRTVFDEVWVIDLEGDNLGTRKTENVFQIQSPVAIAVGVRYNKDEKRYPLAKAHYAKLEGSREEKLAQLNRIEKFGDLEWRDCLSGKTDYFLPINKTNYWQFPLLTDLFPWQENGVQFKRSWPIGESKELLQNRWNTLLHVPQNQRGRFLRETEARKASKDVTNFDNTTLPALSKIKPDSEPLGYQRYAYRSFDRQWAILDPRLADRPRPDLLRAHSIRQLYLTSLLTNVLGEGPSAIVTNLLPDLDHFRGSFGAKHVIPLWQGQDGMQPNLTAGVLETLEQAYGFRAAPEDFFSYAYAVLFSPRYVQRFWEELTIPGLRLPVTANAARFENSVRLGKQLIYYHTYGERFVPQGQKPGQVPQGTARCKVGVPASKEDYPETFRYDEQAQELIVGKGIFNQVRPAVWNFSVSGLQVVKSWLAYRMKERAGRKSSPLDEIRPEVWTFDNELLDLLWVLDHTIDLLPEINENFEQIIRGELIPEGKFPKPTSVEQHSKSSLPLFDQAGIEMEEE